MTARLGIVGLLALVLAFAPLTVRAQGSIVDSQMAVTTALAQSSLTIEALKKADDARCRELQARIEALTAQVKAGRAKQTDLVAAKEALVARLSETNLTYKAEIDAFRGAVTDIASTPEGAAALTRYNAGDQVGALAILDRLQAADEAARQKATDIDKAVGERHIAELALDARDKGKVTTASVVARYEAVVKLDPGVWADWIDLNRLYRDAGRMPEATKAAKMAIGTADTDRNRGVAYSDLGYLLTAQGDLAGANKALDEALAIARRLVAADPSELDDQRNLAADLETRGDSLHAQADMTGARAAIEESLSIARGLTRADPGNVDFQKVLTTALGEKGDLLIDEGDLANARAAYEESLAIRRRISESDPENADLGKFLAIGLAKAGDMLKKSQDFTGANDFYEKALTLFRKLAAADSANAEAQVMVLTCLDRVGDNLTAEGDLTGAYGAFGEELAIARVLAAADPSSDRQKDVASSLDRVGDNLIARGDTEGASKALEEELAIWRRLAGRASDDYEVQHGIGLSLSQLARLPASNVSWAEAELQWANMARHGPLLPNDQAWFDYARGQAAAAPR